MATPEPATVFRWAAAATCGVLAVLLAAYGLYLVVLTPATTMESPDLPDIGEHPPAHP